MNKYYVYVHKKATDNSVFYVGRGKLKRKTSRQNRNLHWKHIVDKHGFYVEIIEENLSLEESNEKEIYWIKKYRDDGLVLANIADGGGGVSGRARTQEEKQRISKKLTGKPHSEEHKAKMLGNTNGAGKRSEEFGKKLSKALKGIPKSKNHCEKLRKALKGRPMAPQHYANVIAANARRKLQNKDIENA